MTNTYVDINTLKYFLFNVHELDKVLKQDRFKENDKESALLFLDAVKAFSDREMYPYFKEMDTFPAHYKDGEMKVHPQVGVMMKKSAEMGLISASFDQEIGGLQLPMMLVTAAYFIMEASNNHLTGYPGLTSGAAELIARFGNAYLNETYVPKMLSGAWGGTMCLTEPQAGSSLSDITTKAIPTTEGYYKIIGQKIFISGGDYPYVDNVVHLVLARVEGAPSGTKGISLFVVPKKRPATGGKLEANGVITIADFQKMGQRGYCTTHLGFGNTKDCYGWLVGEINQGLSYMFLMMNGARIAVGRGASAIATAAYQSSLQYAKERPQGRKLSNTGTKNTDENQTPIINHADVKRMLLFQKVIAEGSLSLVLLASKYDDLRNTLKDQVEKQKYEALLDLIIPVVKTYPSEMGIRAVSNGIQVLGGYGFCTDYILQQYYRDIRIFSIYEGTTGIQSQDLLGRKLMANNGQSLKFLLDEVTESIGEATTHHELRMYASLLKDKLQLTNEVVQFLLSFAKKGAYERFLSDATVFMEFFSHLLLGWVWLTIATRAKNDLVTGQKAFDEQFYESKLHAMKFYYKYELSKMDSLSNIIMDDEVLTLMGEKKLF